VSEDWNAASDPELADDIIDQDTPARGWTRVTSPTEAPPVAPPPHGSGRLLLFVGAATLIAATVLTLGFRSDSQLTFELRGASAQAGIIEARRGEATVALSDGSSILAENSTRFHVDLTGRNAATTRLLAGKLHVAVVPNEDTSYRFLAGPYEVRVVGTELDLSWSDQSGLSVSISKGEARLFEPGRRARVLRVGDAVRLPAVAPQLPVR
jgi:ferric-dicitrate binding protein FerR (iron transport regulator)